MLNAQRRNHQMRTATADQQQPEEKRKANMFEQVIAELCAGRGKGAHTRSIGCSQFSIFDDDDDDAEPSLPALSSVVTYQIRSKHETFSELVMERLRFSIEVSIESY